MIPFLKCMVLVSQLFHLPPRVLPSIHAVEGGFIGSVSHNTDGSDDLGLMQVNTLWLEPIARARRMPVADVRQRLVFDGCFSVWAAGAIMRTYMIETHDNVMQAVGDYHSHTPDLNKTYQAQVIAAAERLFRRSPHPAERARPAGP